MFPIVLGHDRKFLSLYNIYKILKSIYNQVQYGEAHDVFEQTYGWFCIKK